ncbi:AbrB/MazE/SpoVT family DNA-binding domain-containing protein [uncultured Corynebacterium sp.]|uniref:AbrB/MazE/SpoVT family DNA-binding domain-containing protein n=1 Tax=uncultured Corynebacterium sp. TaxID=159447 RepID=UPI0025D0E554|nr:AbrB/MazE/SpoVT family DNA-binding domain-containing protein [uncultured Corynebacterium sp.]
MTMYTTITSKGQITLPAQVRHALHLKPGQKVSVNIEDGRIIVDAPPEIEDTRAQLRAEAIRQGTWGTAPVSGDGWQAQAEARHGES